MRGRYIASLVAAVVLLTILTPLSHATATISGRIVDVNGEPLKGVTVEAYTLDGVFKDRTTTLHDGTFVLRLEEGAYELVIYKKGYEEKRLKIEAKGDKYTFLEDIVLDYALQISLEAKSLRVKQGDVFELDMSVANRGHYSEDVAVSMLFPDGWDAKLLTLSGLEIGGFTLQPEEVGSFKLRVQVGRDASGYYQLSVVFEGSVRIVRTIEVYVEPRDWGILDAPYTRVIGYRGEEVCIEITVRNTVGEDADFLLSLDAPEGWDVRLETQEKHTVSSVRLKEGDETKLVLRAYVPEDAEEKVYEIKVTAEALGARSTLDIKVRVERGVDRLKAESPSPFIEARSGRAAAIPFTIYNRGTAATPVTLRVEGLPPGFSYSFKKEDGSLVSKVYLTPGASIDLYLEVEVPYGLEPQLIEFTLVVEGESSRDQLKLGLNVLGEYKLRILTENFYVTMTVGSREKFVVKVRNDGSSPIKDLTLTPYDVPEGIDVEVDPDIVANLPPGEEAMFVLTLDASPKLAAGFYHIPLLIEGKEVREERVLKVDVRPKGEYIYVGVLILLISLFIVIFAWRKYGRR